MNNIEWHFDAHCDWSGNKSVVYLNEDYKWSIDILPSFQVYSNNMLNGTFEKYRKDFKLDRFHNKLEFYCYLNDNELNSIWPSICINQNDYIKALIDYIENNILPLLQVPAILSNLKKEYYKD